MAIEWLRKQYSSKHYPRAAVRIAPSGRVYFNYLARELTKFNPGEFVKVGFERVNGRVTHVLFRRGLPGSDGYRLGADHEADGRQHGLHLCVRELTTLPGLPIFAEITLDGDMYRMVVPLSPGEEAGLGYPTERVKRATELIEQAMQTGTDTRAAEFARRVAVDAGMNVAAVTVIIGQVRHDREEMLATTPVHGTRAAARHITKEDAS